MFFLDFPILPVLPTPGNGLPSLRPLKHKPQSVRIMNDQATEIVCR